MQTLLRATFSWFVFTAAAFAAQDSGSGRANNGPSNSNNSSRSDNGNNGQNSSATGNVNFAATDPSYKLNIGDTIYVTIGTASNPVETSASPTISKRGDVRLPWIEDEITLDGKTVRDSERFLENLYKERKMLNRPVVSVKVANYFPREVAVAGAVRSPGLIPFLPDTVSMDIGDVIMKAGGFSPIAKASSVRVDHRDANGKESTQYLDLEGLITGRRKAGKDRAEVPVYPGDRIFVPESFF